MIAYEIIKKKPVTQHQPAWNLPAGSTPYHQRMGLFERRALARRQQAENMPPPIFDLRAVAPEVNKDTRMPYTDELVTELRSKGEFKNNPTGLVPLAMGKFQYVKWLNDHVYPFFAKGGFVTFKTVPIVLNQVPKVVFVVRDIQEMHYFANMDKETREPKAVGIALPEHTIPCYYPPSLLRKLEPSEVEALDKLRNQASEGRNRDAANDNAGNPVVIDRSTGEILVEEE